MSNSEFIDDQLGTVKDNYRFVDGILFSPSTLKGSASNLQTVFQADTAHLNWGKYTLYSLYGTTAACQCTAISFGIIFGNEDMESWILLRCIHSWTHQSILSSPIKIRDQKQQLHKFFYRCSTFTAHIITDRISWSIVGVEHKSTRPCGCSINKWVHHQWRP